jgi:hypothetical protein
VKVDAVENPHGPVSGGDVRQLEQFHVDTSLVTSGSASK